MVDPGWVLARKRGKRPRDFKCNSDTAPEDLPGTLGLILALTAYHFFRGHSIRDWSRELRPLRREGCSTLTPQRNNSV